MKIPIPDDWDGESWRSVCVQFPDSVGWLALFNGMLSQWRRGRFWDENSGSILGVLVTGNEIWDRNSALPDCEGNETPPDIITIIRRCTASAEAESEAFDMGCDGSGLPIKIEGGKLYWWHCCDWVEVGSMGAGTDIGDDPWTPGEITPPAYSACGKAFGIVDAVYTAVEAAANAVDEYPWQMIGFIEDAVGYDLDNNWLLVLLAQWVTGDWIGQSYADVYDPYERQLILCKLVSIFDDDAIGVPSEAMFEQIKGIFRSEIWPDPKWVMWDAAINAIGQHDMDTIAKVGAIDVTSDCTCPEEADPTGSWPDMDWVHFWDYRVDDYTAVPNELTEWVASQGFVDWASESTRYAKTAISIPLVVEAGTITRVWARFYVGAGFDWSGDLMRIETDAVGLYGPTTPGGDPVAASGERTIDSPVSRVITAADDAIKLTFEGHVGDPVGGPTDPDSPRLIAFAIGGTGTDPFA
jgi:hypothetical protein